MITEEMITKLNGIYSGLEDIRQKGNTLIALSKVEDDMRCFLSGNPHDAVALLTFYMIRYNTLAMIVKAASEGYEGIPEDLKESIRNQESDVDINEVIMNE